MKKLFFIITLLIKVLYAIAQNVGIGTTTPDRAKLEVHGSVGSTSAIFGGDTTGVSLQSNWPTIGFNEYYNGGHRYIAKGYAAQQFVDPALGYMAIDLFPSGNANAVASNARRAVAFTYSGNVILGDGNSRVLVNRNTPTSNSFGATLEINQSASRGIGLINGPDQWQISSVGGGSTPFMELEYNGITKGFFRSTTGEYVVFSDKRLKRNIQGMSSLLDRVMKLQPVEYEMTEHNPAHEKSFGFIAQDVKGIFPELVTVLPDSARGSKRIKDLHAVNYNGFGVLSIKAIQEQQQLIQSLQAELSELKKAVNELQGVRKNSVSTNLD